MIYESRIPDSERVAFTSKVRSIASKYGFRSDWLMIVMYFETGGNFRTTAHNSGSSAVGLIGFTSDTARTLGTTVGALSAMSRVQQLAYVDKYLSVWKAGSKVSSLTDLYMIVYSPANAGKPHSHVLSRTPSREYELNKGLDKAKKGYITIADVGERIKQYAGDIPTGETTPTLWVWGVLVLIVLIVFITRQKS